VTAAAASSASRWPTPRLGRNQTIGMVFGLLGALLLFYTVPNLEPGRRAFAFEPPPDPARWSFDPALVTTIVAVIFLVTAVACFVPRLERYAGALLLTSTILCAPLVLAIALALSEAPDTNVVQLLVESLRLGTPIALGAMVGLWCERAGVVNIGIEGMMLASAGVGFTVYAVLGDASSTGWLWFAILVAILTGALFGLVHAVLAVSFRTDQIISGVAINLFALGMTSFLRSQVLVPRGISSGKTTPTWEVPGLASIPVIGEQFFSNKPIFYAMLAIVTASWFILFRTPWGLRIRSVGENPHAAETLGINVIKIRYQAVIIGGCIAGLAGAWFSLENPGGFQDGMTNGAGFIALAALIFGRWRPWSAFAGAMLFGFTRALGTRMQFLGVEIGDFKIPSEFWQSLPYVVTIIVVAGAIGRAVPPAADGQPYERSR
jgi:simple sugar transport system permease protein